QELRAAPVGVSLVPCLRGELRACLLGAFALAPDERASVPAGERVLRRLLPRGPALGTSEAPALGIEATPLDDPVLAAVGQDHAIHRSTAFCTWSRFSA